MNKETIEKAADHYADTAPASYTNGTFGKYAIADAFEEGAHHVLDRLSRIPWNEAMHELAEYAKQRLEHRKEATL